MDTTKKGIKEFKELIAGLKEAVKAIKEIRDIVKNFKAEDADKMKAVMEAIALLKGQFDKLEVYKDAFEGMDELKEELKDLDTAEIMELITELVDAVKEIERA